MSECTELLTFRNILVLTVVSTVPRCGKCLTKIYCDNEYLEEDLRTKHEDACKDDSDLRKKKAKVERRVRKEEKTRVDEQSARMLNNIDNAIDRTIGSDYVREQFRKMTMVANAKM